MNDPHANVEVSQGQSLADLPYEHPYPSCQCPPDSRDHAEEAERLRAVAEKRGLVITAVRDWSESSSVVAVHTLGLTAAGLPEVITDPLHVVSAESIGLIRQVGHYLLAHPEAAVPGQRVPLDDGATAMLAEAHEHDLDCLSYVFTAYDEDPHRITLLRARRLPAIAEGASA